MGEKLGTACKFCDGEEPGTFWSFPESGMPSTLVAHWNPSHEYKTESYLNSTSFKNHYVPLEDQDNSLATRLFKKYSAELRKDCKVS